MNSKITIDDILANTNKIKEMIRARGGSDHIVDLVLKFRAEVNDARRTMKQNISSANLIPRQLPPEIQLGTRDAERANRRWFDEASVELARLVDSINDSMPQLSGSFRN